MKVVLLGTAGYHPNDRRDTACVLLPQAEVMFDAGTGVHRLRRYAWGDRFDIFLSHAHLDHVVGLTYLFDTLPQQLLSNVVVHGEAEKLAAIREHLFSDSLFPVEPPYQFHALEGPVELPFGGKVSCISLKHPGGSLGYRLDHAGRSLAYITDTAAAPEGDYLEFIRGVDLLLHEAHFVDDEANMASCTGHTCVQAAAQVAASAHVGKLVLIHLNPQLCDDRDIDLQAARQVFPATEIGTDGMELDW